MPGATFAPSPGWGRWIWEKQKALPGEPEWKLPMLKNISKYNRLNAHGAHTNFLTPKRLNEYNSVSTPRHHLFYLALLHSLNPHLNPSPSPRKTPFQTQLGTLIFLDIIPYIDYIFNEISLWRKLYVRPYTRNAP